MKNKHIMEQIENLSIKGVLKLIFFIRIFKIL